MYVYIYIYIFFFLHVYYRTKKLNSLIVKNEV